MIDRKHIEDILKLNGVQPGAPDQQIKELLIRARWHEDDVETALVVLRENPKDKKQKIDAVHKIIHSNDKLAPETLSAILGIDVEVNEVVERHRKSLQNAYRRQVLSLAAVSILLAVAFLTVSMGYLQFADYLHAR